MQNKRIFAIAAMILLAVLLMLGAGLDAAQFGAVMLGAALIVAILMYIITRRRKRRSTRMDLEDRKPPKL